MRVSFSFPGNLISSNVILETRERECSDLHSRLNRPIAISQRGGEEKLSRARLKERNTHRSRRGTRRLVGHGEEWVGKEGLNPAGGYAVRSRGSLVEVSRPVSWRL